MIEDAKPELGTRPDAVPPRLQAHSKKRRTTGGFAMGFATVASGPIRERPISASESRAPPARSGRFPPRPASGSAPRSRLVHRCRIVRSNGEWQVRGGSHQRRALRITPAKKRARCFDTPRLRRGWLRMTGKERPPSCERSSSLGPKSYNTRSNTCSAKKKTHDEKDQE